MCFMYRFFEFLKSHLKKIQTKQFQFIFFQLYTAFLDIDIRCYVNSLIYIT